ncbi:MAG: hypothetical protein AB7V77_03175 [Candidatus Woesearchaeota archaeon]
MFNKKAQVEIQFNWIFVIIVGMVFLGFFLMMLISQSSSNEQKVSITLTRNFQAIIDSVSQQSDVLNEYNFPAPFTYSLECNDERGLYNYKLNDVKVADIKYDIIFSPTEMKGRNIFPITRKWDLPNSQGFSVTNFLYLSNDFQGYIFINSSSDDMKKLYTYFPENKNVHLSTNSNNFENYNYDNYNFITLFDDVKNEKIDIPNQVQGKNNRYVVINPLDVNDIFKIGEACVFENQIDLIIFQQSTQPFKNECKIDGEHTTYLGEASLYGIIFSDDIQTYECMMNKAFQKLRLTAILQYNKITYYSDSMERNTNSDVLKCKQYLELLSDIESPKKLLTELSNPEKSTTESLLETPFTDDDFDLQRISDILTQLQSYNRVLASYSNCIELY